MAFDLTVAQYSNLSAATTRPLYAVEIAHSGTSEYYSTGGILTLDGFIYSPGIDVVALKDRSTATVKLPITTTLLTESIYGAWRGGMTLKIHAIPDLPSSPMDFTSEHALLVLDGHIDTSSTDSTHLTVTGIHKTATASYTPRLRLNEISDIIPPSGSSFSIGIAAYTLKARR